MKTRTLASLIAAAALIVGGFSAKAQEPVSTGIVQGVIPAVGALILRSDQTTRPITFYGMERANIFSVDGDPMVTADIQPGMRATVQFAAMGKRWLISKVILEEQEPSVIVGTTYFGYPDFRTPNGYFRSPTLFDRDITTRPAGGAFFDRDVTTWQAGRAASDNDITTRPATEPNRIRVRRRGP